MEIVNIHEAKARLSDLLRKAARGEEIVISRRNVPLARLVPVARPGAARGLGWARGAVDVAPDFDETPEDFADCV
jgi:prevent-host-death family protein